MAIQNFKCDKCKNETFNLIHQEDTIRQYLDIICSNCGEGNGIFSGSF